MTVLVEGFEPDQLALAAHLAAAAPRGSVRLAATGPAPREALALAALGVAVEPHADLDRDPGPADVAYLDVWTPEVAVRVQKLRAQGTRVSCLGDLLLEQWPGPTLAITGTAGKTTTTSLVAAALRAAGVDAAVSAGARAGNLWPTADLLDHLASAAPARLLVLELTSSHLAYMHASPDVAAVISFWPDHLELHGDLARYRAAKETIVRHQRPGDRVVVNADDASAGLADVTPAERVEFSLTRRVERGAYLDRARGVVLAAGGHETSLGPIHLRGPHPANVVAAAAIADTAGAAPDAIAAGIATAPSLPWRAQPAGTLAGVPVVDDGMAATPAKAAAALAAHSDASVVLIAGGLLELGGGPVHATPEEQELLERACDEIARVARLVVVFGDAGTRLAGLLQPRGVEVRAAPDLEEAVALAARAAGGAAAVVFSPLFPVLLHDRARFSQLVDPRRPRPTATAYSGGCADRKQGP